MNKIKGKQFPQKETHHHNQGIYQNTTNIISIIFYKSLCQYIK